MFKRVLVLCLILLGISGSAMAEDVYVKLETNMGNITLQLYKDKAPVTVDNFVQYVKDGFYDNTIFHRVIKGFMNQGGYIGVSQSSGDQTLLTFKDPTRAAIINESTNGLSNAAYTIAMARTTEPNSATSQFFINAVDNLFLDKKNAKDGVGYAVFGKVVDGKSVVDAINVVATTTFSGMENMPTSLVIITKARVINSPVCFNTDDALNITASCVQYQGVQYGFTLNHTMVSGDPTGHYWKINPATASVVQKDACMPVGDDFKVNLCADYHGTQFEFALNYVPISGIPAWKADLGTFKQRN
jgi:peptidyl-prolyl cis-trans isomerase B (cyclophilin B)